MNKLTSVSAILRSEVKGQVEFDLLVAVARASGIPLESQSFESSDYFLTYLTFTAPRHGITQTHEIVGMPRTLISFEDAVFSLAEPEWTHIWQDNISESFYYGDGKDIRFDISSSEASSGHFYKPYGKRYYTLIATREPVVVEPPKPKFAVGDVIKDKTGGVKHKMLHNNFDAYEKVTPIREKLADVLRKSDFPIEAADVVLAQFDVTEKS